MIHTSGGNDMERLHYKNFAPTSFGDVLTTAKRLMARNTRHDADRVPIYTTELYEELSCAEEPP